MAEEIKQICRKCLLEKDISMFHRRGDKHVKECKPCVAIRTKKFREENDLIIKEKKKKYWKENKDRFKEKRTKYDAEYKARDPENVRKLKREWASKNKKKNQAYFRQRYNSDPQFNLEIKIRRRINMSLKRINGGRKDRTINLLGCSFAQFRVYFESKFTDGMTWELVFKGEIHVDHKIPCSKFNLLDPEEQKVCFHYTNLQPLWAKDNMIKHNKYTEIAL